MSMEGKNEFLYNETNIRRKYVGEFSYFRATTSSMVATSHTSLLSTSYAASPN